MGPGRKWAPRGGKDFITQSYREKSPLSESADSEMIRVSV